MLRFTVRQRPSVVIVLALLIAGTAGGLGLIRAAERISVQDRPNATSGSHVVVAIEASSDIGVLSASFGLTYSTELLTPVGVYTTPLTQGFELSFDIDTPGDLTVDLRGRNPVFEPGAIVWVLFESHGAVGLGSDLVIHDARLNDSDFVELEHGWIELLDGPVTVSIPTDLTGGTGQSVIAPLSVDDATGIRAAFIVIQFDPQVLEAVNVMRTPISQVLPGFFANLNVPGEVSVSLFATAGQEMSGSGPILEYEFEVVGQADQETPIVIDQAQLNEDLIVSVLQDGYFVVCDSSDQDGDGVSVCDGDCDDGEPDAFPDNPEVGCDLIDNDCDPVTPDILDHDGDGSLCDADCDDFNEFRFPGNPEVCDGIDNDCDLIPDNPPAPVTILAVMPTDGAGQDFNWNFVADATGYDVVRGVVSDLHATAGDYSQATEVCLADDTTDTFIEDTDSVPQQDGFWYIIRPINCGGSGTYDSGGGTQAEPRDLEVNASPNSCP